MKSKTAAIIIAVIVIAAVAGYFVVKNRSNSNTASTSSTNSASTNSSHSSPQSSANTITFDGSSFSPATLTVSSGSTVTVKNTSNTALQFDSDPHPVHTDDTDLNAGAVPAGQSVTFTATKKGTFGYHDHLDPSIKGSITVN